jgi:hypothetical protein
MSSISNIIRDLQNGLKIFIDGKNGNGITNAMFKPTPENEVKYWVELVNGMAVGYYEPRLGKAEFPVYSMQK